MTVRIRIRTHPGIRTHPCFTCRWLLFIIGRLVFGVSFISYEAGQTWNLLSLKFFLLVRVG